MKQDDFVEVKEQKLILTHDEGAFLYFCDENKDEHGSLFEEEINIDLHALVTSCFGSVDGDKSVLTCGCGVAGCAGFHHFSSIITDKEILWRINKGEVLFCFDKEQYIGEVKTKLLMLIDLCSKEKTLEYFATDSLDTNELNKLYAPFVDEK